MVDLAAMPQQHPNSPPPAKNNNTNSKPGPVPIDPQRRAYLADEYKMRPEQVDVVRNAICIGATDAELEFFLLTCRRVQLDPFARQIWFVKRRQKIENARGDEEWVDVGRPETGIDGYRTIAERTGEYEGQGSLLWCGPDGKFVDVWLKSDPPAAARATIFRKGFREPMISTALFTEFCPKYANGKVPVMWSKMAANQLAKCAEAGGFRRAFPRDLSGLVTDVEMEHVDIAASYSAPPKPVETKSAPQLEARKPDRATEIVTKAPDTAKQATPVEVQTAAREILEDAGATAEDIAAMGDAARSVDDSDGDLQLRADLDEMILEVQNADSQDALNRVGGICHNAKEKTDARSTAIMKEVWPKLQEKWRELKRAASSSRRGTR